MLTLLTLIFLHFTRYRTAAARGLWEYRESASARLTWTNSILTYPNNTQPLTGTSFHGKWLSGLKIKQGLLETKSNYSILCRRSRLARLRRFILFFLGEWLCTSRMLRAKLLLWGTQVRWDTGALYSCHLLRQEISTYQTIQRRVHHWQSTIEGHVLLLSPLCQCHFAMNLRRWRWQNWALPW
jgi:hypothetical protein